MSNESNNNQNNQGQDIIGDKTPKRSAFESYVDSSAKNIVSTSTEFINKSVAEFRETVAKLGPISKDLVEYHNNISDQNKAIKIQNEYIKEQQDVLSNVLAAQKSIAQEYEKEHKVITQSVWKEMHDKMKSPDFDGNEQKLRKESAQQIRDIISKTDVGKAKSDIDKKVQILTDGIKHEINRISKLSEEQLLKEYKHKEQISDELKDLEKSRIKSNGEILNAAIKDNFKKSHKSLDEAVIGSLQNFNSEIKNQFNGAGGSTIKSTIFKFLEKAINYAASTASEISKSAIQDLDQSYKNIGIKIAQMTGYDKSDITALYGEMADKLKDKGFEADLNSTDTMNTLGELVGQGIMEGDFGTNLATAITVGNELTGNRIDLAQNPEFIANQQMQYDKNIKNGMSTEEASNKMYDQITDFANIVNNVAEENDSYRAFSQGQLNNLMIQIANISSSKNLTDKEIENLTQSTLGFAGFLGKYSPESTNSIIQSVTSTMQQGLNANGKDIDRLIGANSSDDIKQALHDGDLEGFFTNAIKQINSLGVDDQGGQMLLNALGMNAEDYQKTIAAYSGDTDAMITDLQKSFEAAQSSSDSDYIDKINKQKADGDDITVEKKWQNLVENTDVATNTLEVVENIPYGIKMATDAIDGVSNIAKEILTSLGGIILNLSLSSIGGATSNILGGAGAAGGLGLKTAVSAANAIPAVGLATTALAGGYAVGTLIDSIPKLWGGDNISSSLADAMVGDVTPSQEFLESAMDGNTKITKNLNESLLSQIDALNANTEELKRDDKIKLIMDNNVLNPETGEQYTQEELKKKDNAELDETLATENNNLQGMIDFNEATDPIITSSSSSYALGIDNFKEQGEVIKDTYSDMKSDNEDYTFDEDDPGNNNGIKFIEDDSMSDFDKLKQLKKLKSGIENDGHNKYTDGTYFERDADRLENYNKLIEIYEAKNKTRLYQKTLLQSEVLNIVGNNQSEADLTKQLDTLFSDYADIFPGTKDDPSTTRGAAYQTATNMYNAYMKQRPKNYGDLNKQFIDGTLSFNELRSYYDSADYDYNYVAPKFAVGLDYVPYDNFPALLHKGERVTTAANSTMDELNRDVLLHKLNNVYDNNTNTQTTNSIDVVSSSIDNQTDSLSDRLETIIQLLQSMLFLSDNKNKFIADSAYTDNIVSRKSGVSNYTNPIFSTIYGGN